MKNQPRNKFPALLWLPFLLLWSTTIFAQQDGQEVVRVIPQHVDAKLRRDAARLALRSLADAGTLEHQLIVIPDYKIEEIYRVLSLIYKQNAKARAVEKCDVHTFPDPSIDRLIVILKKSAPWAESIRKGDPMTGRGYLNGLLAKYQLNIEKLVRWDDAHDALVLRAEEPLNMAALAVIFQKIEDVVKVETGIPDTTGNDIQFKSVKGGWEVTYILRFGSHISGKGKMHTWRFQVMNGNVKFLGERGDPLPTWMDCARVEKN